MARRIVTFHIEVAVDEDAIRAHEDDAPIAWPNLIGCLSTAFRTIAEDNLDPDFDAQVRLVVGSTKIEYRR